MSSTKSSCQRINFIHVSLKHLQQKNTAMIYAGLTASLSCCLNLEQLILKQDMLDILDITWKDKTHFIYRMYKSFYQMNTFHTSEEAKTPKGLSASRERTNS